MYRNSGQRYCEAMTLSGKEFTAYWAGLSPLFRRISILYVYEHYNLGSPGKKKVRFDLLFDLLCTTENKSVSLKEFLVSLTKVIDLRHVRVARYTQQTMSSSASSVDMCHCGTTR